MKNANSRKRRLRWPDIIRWHASLDSSCCGRHCRLELTYEVKSLLQRHGLYIILYIEKKETQLPTCWFIATYGVVINMSAKENTHINCIIDFKKEKKKRI